MNCIKQKYESFCMQWKLDSFRKGFSSVIGAIIMNFFNGAIYSLCTLAVYQISYIKAKGGSIEIENLTYYYPIELLFQCISAFISGIIYKTFGLHATNLLGVATLIIGYYLMYLSNHFALDVLSMILGGIGTGIILYPSTTNAYEWFPSNNGLIVGIMETMISFGSFFWSFIGEKIINYDEEISDEETNLYSMEIAIKIKLYLIIQIIGWLVAYILQFLLTYERKNYNPEIQIDIKSEEGHLFSKKSDTDTNTDFDESFLNIDNINYDENVIGNDQMGINKRKKRKKRKAKIKDF
jgi:MFS family permease